MYKFCGWTTQKILSYGIIIVILFYNYYHSHFLLIRRCGLQCSTMCLLLTMNYYGFLWRNENGTSIWELPGIQLTCISAFSLYNNNHLRVGVLPWSPVDTLWFWLALKVPGGQMTEWMDKYFKSCKLSQLSLEIKSWDYIRSKKRII